MIKYSLSTLAALLACLAASASAIASPMSDGDAAYKAGSYSAALSDFQQAASQSMGPDQAKAYYHEGLTYHKLHEDSQAVSAYQQAQTADPSLSFASSPDKFTHNLQVAQSDAGAAPAGQSTPGASQTATTPSSDPAAIALANGDVYVSPSLAPQVNQVRLTDAAEADGQTPVKIVVLDHLPPGYTSPTSYAHRLHDYLNLGNGGIIVVAAHGQGARAGVADVAGQLSDAKERAIAQKYVAQIGAGDYTTPLTNMAADLASTATGTYYVPMEIITGVFLLIAAVIIIVIMARSKRKREQINSLRGPLERDRDSVIAGIEQIDNFIDVLPKNNADTDQVRAFRQAAAYKVEQAEKIMNRSTEVSDMNRAQALIDQAGGDVANGKRYLDRATGGSGIVSEEAVRPIPFPATQQQVSQVPDEQRGVSFFSSQPAPVNQLVPVTLNVDGHDRSVMATPQEADMIRRGQIPPVRSFNVGGQSVPWYAYQNYDPYQDYWTYQNNGWRGVAGGAIAGFIGAELLNSLFSPRPYWGGGWNSPYAYGPGWDNWGGWNDYGGGGFNSGYDQGVWQGEQMGRAQDYALQDQNTSPQQDPNYDGASFMGSGGGYDTTDYGSQNDGANFMGGGDNS